MDTQDIAISAILWAAVLYKLPVIYHKWGEQKLIRASAGIRISFAACAACYVDPIYTTLGAVSGIPNIAWLLSYLLFLSGMFYTTWFLYCMKGEMLPRWHSTILIATVVLLAWLFADFHLDPSANFSSAVGTTRAGTTQQLLFLLCLYSVSVALSIDGLRVVIRWLLSESNLLARFRIRCVMTVLLLAIPYIGLRGLISILSFLLPSEAISVELIGTVGRVLMLLIVGLLVYLSLPLRISIATAKPFVWLDKYGLLKSLTRLEKQLNRVESTPYDHVPDNVPFFSGIDYRIHQKLIAILDIKHKLGHPLSVNESNSDGVVDHRPLLTQQLYASLQQVNDEQPYDDALNAYRNLSTQLSGYWLRSQLNWRG